MIRSMFEVKTDGFLFASSGSIGFRGGTVPSFEPGFGILSVAWGPWQDWQFFVKSTSPCFQFPTSVAASADGPCFPESGILVISAKLGIWGAAIADPCVIVPSATYFLSEIDCGSAIRQFPPKSKVNTATMTRAEVNLWFFMKPRREGK